MCERTETPEAVSLTEFSQRSGLSTATVGRLMDAGKIPELDNFGARVRLIPTRFLTEWLTNPINQTAGGTQ